MPEPEGIQGALGEAFEIVPDEVMPAKKSRIAAHEREHKNKNKNLNDGTDDTALFFNESKVPVEVIAVAAMCSGFKAGGRPPRLVGG
jgi:hypothetical protein